MVSVFAQWLDVTMSNEKISGKELADHAGVHESAISKYRTGNATPGMRVLTKIAECLEVDPLRLAATAGLIDPQQFNVEPLPLPKPIIRRQHVRKRISAIPGLTGALKDELLQAYDEIMDRAEAETERESDG